MRKAQLSMLKNQNSAYGGELRNTRQGRARPRPLAVRNTMHLVMRSSLARGEWSFRKPKHKKRIEQIFSKFSKKYGVKILSLANVGNHVHLHVHLSNRYSYKPFIRATTSAIAMAIMGTSRWRKPATQQRKFWDYRPFTRVVLGFKALLRLKDYLRINELEGFGHDRKSAAFWIKYGTRFENTA